MHMLDKDMGPISKEERDKLLPSMKKLCEDLPIHRQLQFEVSESEMFASTVFVNNTHLSTRVKRTIRPGGEFTCHSPAQK